MTFDRWLALANLAWPIVALLAGGAWRAFSRIEKRLDRIEGVLRFHHQVLAWHEGAINDLEERKPA